VSLPKLVVITDWSLGESTLFARLEQALAGGSSIAVQHRNPTASLAAYFDQALRLKVLCDRLGAPMFVSARLDVALALGTHLHLPARALRPEQVRAALPANRWICAAVHDEAEAEAARGASFALVSPVFATASKPGQAPLGPTGFARLASLLSCPSYALGGVSAAGLRGLKAEGTAAISAVLHAADPALAARQLLAGLDSTGEFASRTS
jgi:thiamine-phosphate pyrophosphorylase